MNENNPHIEAQTFVPAPFPTWPPPSGGAPFPGNELGPITNPFPYGSAQQANISIANPSPPYNAMKYPQKMPSGATGQNQKQSLPPLPQGRDCVLPDKASPLISAISPTPIMGPGSSQPHMVQSQIARSGVAIKNFPAGSYIDGLGNVVTPTRIIGGLGN